MTPEIDFYIKISAVFVVSSLIWLKMLQIQKKKEQEANEKFEFAIKLIEMRNKKGTTHES